MNTRMIRAVFTLVALSEISKSASAKKADDTEMAHANHVTSCVQPQTTSVAQWYEKRDQLSSFTNPLQKTPVDFKAPPITKELIGKFITATPKQCHALVSAILKIIKIDPQLASYFDLVFTHLNGFRIITRAKNILKGEAKYWHLTKTLTLPEELDFNSLAGLELIRHEMRHASWHATQEALAKHEQFSCDTHFPLEEKEKLKVEKLLHDGDDNIAKLIKNLRLEKQNRLEAKELKKLKELRKNCQRVANIYSKSLSVTLANKAIQSEAEKALNKKFTPGSVVNIDRVLSDPFKMECDVTIESIEPVDKNDPNGKLKLTFTAEDPLRVAIYLIQKQRIDIRNPNIYPPKHYLMERDAFLFTEIPTPIIRYLYLNYFSYTQKLMLRAHDTNVVFQLPENQYLTPEEEENFAIKHLLTSPIAWHCAADMDQALHVAMPAAQRGYINETIFGLKALINKGHQVGRCNALLGGIYYGLNQPDVSAAHFKRAQKQGAHLSAHENYFFSEALKKSNPKKSKKLAIKAASSLSSSRRPEI